jgi:NitT/TauT family transport system substrate-binding protein
MKKISIILLAVLLLLMIGCTSPEQNEISVEEPLTIEVAGLKGPTSMGMVKLFDEYTVPYENVQFNYSVESAPDLLIGKLVQGELDIAAVPTNLANIIHVKTEGKYQLSSINTLNVLYVVTNGVEVNSLKDLEGKTVHMSGKGATPDFVTRYLLEKNGLTPDEDVTLDFSLDHSSLAQAIVAGDVEVAILPEPFVTITKAQQPEMKVAVDLQEEWEQVEDSLLAFGGLIIKKDLIENHPDVVNQFLAEYEKSVTWVNENPAEAGQLIEKHGIFDNATLAENAIPKANIVYMDAWEVKEEMNQYYEILYNFEPASIGGQLPDESLYYEK